jgi:hypothetical protein
MLLSASMVRAQETRLVTAGKEYEASGNQRRWFGTGYRDIWATPFEAPVLDLSKEGGGLEPVRQVGGLQTPGLAMRGADGRSYTFRSLHKEPERLLPPELRASWPAKMIRDATSATHPGAAVMLPVLAEAAGIPHTLPRLVVMPDDPKLDKFRGTFGNNLGTFEEFPTPGFAGATEIISTAELWERWLQGDRIDSRALLRARVLDLFVDNYDRRRGQWRWMRIPGRPSWVPLPEDPDMAFLHHDGLVQKAMRQFRPQLLEFSDEFPESFEGPEILASEVDRWLLSDVDVQLFRETARDLQSAWTDEVLEKAVAQLPPEWRTVDNGFIASSLKARRAGLVEYVERFYRYITKKVDVHLTDHAERVVIKRDSDEHLSVTATITGDSAPFFERTFNTDDTDEIRIYVHGGDDQVERNGSRSSIVVRVLADEGAKTVQSPDARTEFWRGQGSVMGENLTKKAPWVNPSPVKEAPWIEPRNYGATTIVLPAAWYATDIGFVVGASVTRTTYGFRSLPAAKKQVIRGGWAFGPMAGKIEYHGLFTRPASPIAVDLRAFGSGVEQINYFGLGNETPNQSSSRYRSRQRLFNVAPSLRIGTSSQFQMNIGPELRHARTDMDDPTLLAEEAPYGTGNFGSLRFKATVEVDSRQQSNANIMDLASGSNREDSDQPAGVGIRFRGSTFVAPPGLDVENTYGGVEGVLAGYFGSEDVQLALRAGGARLFGTFPYFDAASLGGSTNRGYRTDRFAGESSVYGSAELRTYITGPKYESIFPVRFGLVGFFDVGRVWQDGEDSRKWHPSGGGGILLKAVGTPIVFRVMVAHSSESTLFYVGSGFRF